MTFGKPSRLGIATLLTLGLYAVPAQALNLRSFISANGSDANSCARTAPCRTLQVAHDATAAGGEINMLDPAGYGALTITKAISIVNDGVGSAGVLVPTAGTAITINAGINDAINIRGLIIEGVGVGANGIVFNTGKSLTVTNCVIRGVTGNGIFFQPNASSTLAVSNTVVANNDFRGIRIEPTGAGTVKASLSRVELYNNGSDGVLVFGNVSTGTINVVVADSVAEKNVGIGFSVISSSAATQLTVVRAVSTNNNVGLSATSAAATLRVSQSTLTGNTTSWSATSSGVLRSYGDNNIDGNLDGDPTPTTIGEK